MFALRYLILQVRRVNVVGRDARELEGRTFQDLSGPEDLAADLEFIAAIHHGLEGRTVLAAWGPARVTAEGLSFALEAGTRYHWRVRAFDADGYRFQPHLSSDEEFVFSRPQPPPVAQSRKKDA